MELSSFCKALPKIELHAHLNGSISFETLKKLHKLRGGETECIPIPDISNFQTLKECFGIFDLVYSMTDNPEAVYLATCDVIEDFHDDNVILLELRTTPRSVDGKMTKDEYVHAVIRAIEACKTKLPGILVKLLISINRKRGLVEAEENIKLAIKLRQEYREYVVGIDLSGDPTEGDAFIQLLQECRDAGLKIAAHCAEVPNEEEIVDILKFRPDRLGHCTCIHKNLGGSEIMYNLLLASEIPVELCLTSNVKCKTVPSFMKHQFTYLYKDKHPICLGTDDKGVFNTTLSKEFELVGTHFGLVNKDLKKLSLSAVRYSFVSEKEKSKLLETINMYSEI